MYGVGNRMKLSHTRKMLNEALEGNLDDVEFITEPIFGLQIPTSVEGVPDNILQPKQTWSDKDAYDNKASELAKMFKENFRKFSDQASKELLAAGPNI